MKRVELLWILLLSIFMFSSCQKQEVEKEEPKDGYQVEFTTRSLSSDNDGAVSVHIPSAEAVLKDGSKVKLEIGKFDRAKGKWTVDLPKETQSFAIAFYIEDGSQVKAQFYGLKDRKIIDEKTFKTREFVYRFSFDKENPTPEHPDWVKVPSKIIEKDSKGNVLRTIDLSYDSEGKVIELSGASAFTYYYKYENGRLIRVEGVDSGSLQFYYLYKYQNDQLISIEDYGQGGKYIGSILLYGNKYLEKSKSSYENVIYKNNSEGKVTEISYNHTSTSSNEEISYDEMNHPFKNVKNFGYYGWYHWLFAPYMMQNLYLSNVQPLIHNVTSYKHFKYKKDRNQYSLHTYTYEYDEDGFPTKRVDADGYITTYEYTKVPPQKELPISLVAEPKVVKKVPTKISVDYGDANVPLSKYDILFKYDKSGRLIEYNDWYVKRYNTITSIKYNPQGKIIETTEREYRPYYPDEAMQLIREVVSHYDYTGENTYIITKNNDLYTVESADKQGRILSMNYSINNNNYKKENVTYDYRNDGYYRNGDFFRYSDKVHPFKYIKSIPLNLDVFTYSLGYLFEGNYEFHQTSFDKILEKDLKQGAIYDVDGYLLEYTENDATFRFEYKTIEE